MKNITSPKKSHQEFIRPLQTGALKLGITVSDHKALQMQVHAEELAIWNKKINLTAIKAPLEVIEKHFIDSIAAASFFKNKGNVIDMGAGGGFPGVVLKIMNPELNVVMVDASRKKVNFLKHVIRQLDLPGLEAVHARVEDLHESEAYRHKFDTVVSRAFTGLTNTAALGSPFIHEKGEILSMKGRNAPNEISPELKERFMTESMYYQLPFEKSDRYMIRLIPRK